MTWIEQAQRDRAGRLWLELSELGIADWATVVGIDECPAQIEGEGRLVTGRFEHSSAEVLNLYVEGERNPIGTTASHPFWIDQRGQDSFRLQNPSKRLLDKLDTYGIPYQLPGQ